MTRPTRAVVDLDAIAANFALLGERAGRAEVIPVVKANAYGHGAVAVARRLSREGARRFAVALAEEGVELREAGIEEEILLLSSGDPGALDELLARRLTPTVHDVLQARELSAAAASLPRPIAVHLKVDTGMGRLGVPPRDLAEVIGILRAAPGLRLAGTFTQFASATDPASGATEAQLRVFAAALSALRDAGLEPGLIHASNSAGILAFPGAAFAAVRPGLALYGVAPIGNGSDPAASSDPILREALTLETRVLAVKTVPAGTPLGYGGAFVTDRTTAVASLPIGYHDGLRRSFSGRVSVLLRGGQAPVVGAVSMDVTLVDVTDSGGRPGDRVVVLGREGDHHVSAWDLARAAGTIPYEILCGIGARVPRVHVP